MINNYWGVYFGREIVNYLLYQGNDVTYYSEMAKVPIELSYFSQLGALNNVATCLLYLVTIFGCYTCMLYFVFSVVES